MVVAPFLNLGTSGSRIRFSPRSDPSRKLILDDQPAFWLSHGCGTCAFYFGRCDDLEVSALSIDTMRHRLTQGLTDLDTEVIDAFARLLPEGDYLPLLLSVTPRLTHPGSETDYFANEQVETWEPCQVDDADSAGPEDPQTPYYRTFETRSTRGPTCTSSSCRWCRQPTTTGPG